MQKIVLSYPKLKERLDNRENSKKESDRALKLLKEIAADFSHTYIRSFQKVLDQGLSKLYDDIKFNEHDTDLNELTKKHCVVIVPNHQSHVDYLAMNYCFYKQYQKPLYVAGGDNLNIFPIGKLFRKSGCFFIRRSFNSDITYKLTLEAYLYYLLKEGHPIEFFFEGGRSRNGKLRPPRFGLYSMLIEAHSHIPDDERKDLYFVPVSIMHEIVPETKAHTKELGGGKKKSESAGQLLSIVKMFAYQFGSIHIRIGQPIKSDSLENSENQKVHTQRLAFECFREVGRNMMVTPSSLLAMILLDDPSGAMTWKDIMSKANTIMEYCHTHEVPITESLHEERMKGALEHALDIFIGNKKVKVMGREEEGHKYYSIYPDCRQELLYFKNTILHHFLVPYIINNAWIQMFGGELNNVNDVKKFFLYQRDQLKHEFYLPTVKQFFYKSLNVVSKSVSKELNSLEELLELPQKDIYKVVKTVSVFGRSLSYILETYYVSSLALTELMKQTPQGFKPDAFYKKVKEIYEHELELGRLIRYPEAYSVPTIRNALQYFSHQKLIENESGFLRVIDQIKFDQLVAKYEKDLADQARLNFRI